MIDAEGRFVKWIDGNKRRRTTEPVPTGDEWFVQVEPKRSFVIAIRIENDAVAEVRMFAMETVAA